MRYIVIQIFTETNILGETEYFREAIFDSFDETLAMKFVENHEHSQDLYIEIVE